MLLCLIGAFLVAITQAQFGFGDHVFNQCSNPVATVSNANNVEVFPLRNADGSCSHSVCVGDCVRVIVDTGSGNAPPVNVIVGGTLPDPGDCSPIAVNTNEPAGSWDFSHAGSCGKGKSGEGTYRNCLVHDTCVWARCTSDSLIAGGFGINKGNTDQFCGLSFRHAINDYLVANVISCAADSNCPDHTYCQSLKCWDGTEGDNCGKDSDCQGSLVCSGPGVNTCKAPKGEGGSCTSDSDCLGYCQMLRCWDGSKGDKCGKDSDCKSRNCRLLRCR